MSSSKCSCSHTRAVHRNQRGRCQVPACPCLYAPPARQHQAAEPGPLGRVTVDGSGLVLDYHKPATPAQRILGDSERRKLEKRLWRELELAGLPLPDELEYRWARAEGRQYRADGFYRPNLLIEVDGGIWMAAAGRHNRGAGYQADHERDNLAVLLGYRVLRFTDKMISNGTAVRTIRRALQPAERLL